MRASFRSRGGRHAARATVLLLMLGHVAGGARPAQAAATPWRFLLPSTFEFTVPANSVAGGIANCPDTYIPVGGGLQQILPTGAGFERVAEYRTGARGYEVVVHNYTAGNITARIGVACALAAHVGGLTVVSTEFGRDAGGEAGGVVTCPTGTMALTGGADWSTFNTNRRVDLTSPTTDGRGWYAAGWSGVAGNLGVEAYCIAASDLGVAGPQVVDVDFNGANDVSRGDGCPAGRRIVSGGVIASPIGGSPDPYTYLAHTNFSSPHGTTTTPVWQTVTHVEAGVRATFVLWCLPVSQPTASITQAPPAHTSSTSATFLWQASDPAGETISWACRLDGGGLPDHTSCAPGSPTDLSALSEGTHTFSVTAFNSSQASATDSRTWTVDVTAPAFTPPAGLSASGPLAVTFSEPVTGVTTSSMQVRVAGLSSIVPGSIVLGTTGTGATKASWLPSSPLVPGESYAVTMTSAVKDLAGNALTGETFLLRASRLVENTSAALREYWDPDASSSASGGAYVVSSLAGSSATWKLTAGSGQAAAVYGVRRPDGGYADVLVDGVRKTTVSFYGASTAWKSKLYTSPALSAGAHTVEVRALGTKPSSSTGTAVALDYLTIGSTVSQESVARQAFRRVPATGASGSSYDLVNHRTSGDTGSTPSYLVTFKSTGVKVYATRTPTSGTARVYVDGALKATINLASASVAYKQLVYSLSGLTEARHTIRVVCAGMSSGSSSTVALDYLTVT
jgi:hypothetical protein